MALQNNAQGSFHLFVTHVDGEGPFLKLCGQLDKQSACMIESLIQSSRENFEKGIGSVPPAAILEGIICAAKYKDGTYYRAKIISTTNLSNGLVGVHFIDYGNKDIISLSTIRFLDSYDPLLLQLGGQATDYYLSRIMHPSRWEEFLLLKLQSLLCYTEYTVTIEAQTRSLPIISVLFQGNDLSKHLVSNKYGIALPVQKQEVLLLQMNNESVQPISSNWQPSFSPEPPSFSEHVPFYINQNFPSNPASTMRLQQNMPIPYNAAYVPPPSSISQRLIVNRVSRAPMSLKGPIRQPQQPPSSRSPVILSNSANPMQTSPLMTSSNPSSPKKSSKTYKSKLLEVNTQHKVFVSYTEEGPELFAVQLATEAGRLQEMMDDINKRPHRSLTEPPMIGTVCLGRMSGDRIICRAIVMNLSGSQCKLFFVDFGDTEMVSYYDIFDIPEEFVKPNVYAMRFCLSGVKGLPKGPHLNETFKQLVNGKILTLRVVTPEGPPLIQYGELYLDSKNVLDLLSVTLEGSLQFKWMDMLTRGSKLSVLVSYVDSCQKFFVQMSDKIDELNAVMDAVKAHCERTSSPGQLAQGTSCCARFADDGNWYRARITGQRGNKIVVAYVDYGNEQEVDVADLRTITPELIALPAQALKCALKGYEDKPVETKTSNQLEMLALEKTLMAHVMGVISGDTMLVSLVDDMVTPPLDIARKMTQLSQPRSHEPKPATPLRKDAPEQFSSPEGSATDERKKGFRREKDFKDDRRPPRDAGEDFAQRGGSFRGREPKESFDRSNPGRHSDKFGARPDKGERRGSSKPWENQTSAPISAADDEWETTPPKQTRDFRDKRKPRPDQQFEKPGWRGKNDSGNKRFKPSESFKPEEANDNQNQQKGSSIQDRLRRDNKFNKYVGNEEKNNDWDSSSRSRERPERRDFRDRPERAQRDHQGDRRDSQNDRRDNWADKKDYQKRDFRDNRGERGDRPQRSNFTPRDRAERSFNDDKKSDRSFNSQDSRSGRTPPFKSRGKFTQVQYKELPNPVSLDTPFADPCIDPNAQHEVSVTWIISPENFYTQILSSQPKFLEMMHTIPEIYKGVKPYIGAVAVGSSVLAKYPEDGVLYRATIISAQPFGKFIVQYIDFGNKFLVDARDIWQLDSQLLELPRMAVNCSLLGVAPKDGEWKANTDIDLCFNAPRYQCVFQENEEGKYKVSLWNNGVSVADTLIEKQLANASDSSGSSVALKDEAIDLTIIVSQQIPCRVTCVESFEKIYVQLDLQKAAAVDSAIANYDHSLLTPLAADSLIDGVHCTVRHGDKIYRAILTDVSDTTSIKAVLADHGATITTSLDNLMILPTELSVYFYQSLECCLNNYTEESEKLMTLEQLKDELTNKKIIIYINDVDSIRLVATLYNFETGKKIAIFSPDEGAYDEVNPLCMRSVFNYNFGLAYVSHSENLNEIYLQKSEDSDRIAQLLHEMFKFYEEGTPEALTNFEAESLCVAKSSDGNWYRATIVSSTDSECHVQFSDYGNSETISKESLKKLDPSFHEPCALSLVAGLGLVAVQDNALDKLKEWIEEKELQVTLSFGSDGWLASLHLDGVDLSMKLVNENLAKPQASGEEVVVEQEVTQQEVPAVPVVAAIPEGCTQVYVSHIDSPGQFWLQMADKVDSIEVIQAELQTAAASYADLETRDIGTQCVAKYSADDQWYRAEVLDSDADITTVRFIDYGNTDVLDNQPGLLKVIPDHLKQVDGYAVKCSVNAVPTGTGQWSEPASEHFTQLVGDFLAPVDALIVLKDVTTYVDLYVNGENLTDKLVSEGHASRSDEAECGGDLPTCFASHVNSPSEFWIQLETASVELQSMEELMVDAENFAELSDKEEGVICAAKYPEDGSWYRAQVIVDGSEGTEVLFMDYGNASIATELRSLPDELKVKPALSRKCALQKPRDIKTWSRQSETKFNELAAEGATIFNVQFIASGDISIVELYLEGKSVTEELVGLCEPSPLSERPTPVGQDLQGSGKICHVNTVEEFFVHLDNSSGDLAKVMEGMIDAPEFESLPEMKVGTVCAAYWAEDEQWYRARVIEFCDVGAHAQFIDYGNKSKCEDFRKLPEDLALIEPIAKCCRLALEASNDNLKKKFDELVDQDCTFQIEFLDTTKEPVLVKLMLDGEDVVNVINTETPATAAEVTSEILEGIVDRVTPGDGSKSEVVESEVLEDKTLEIKAEIVADKVIEESTKTETSEVDVAETAAENVSEKIPDTETSPIETSNTEIAHVKITESTPLEKNEPASEINKVTEPVKPEEITPTPDDHASTKLENEDTELESSQTDLNESMDSTNTVIENKSFESNAEALEKDIECETADASAPERDSSSDTLERSEDSIKTPEKDNSKEIISEQNESKDSINTDTGYISGVEKSFTGDVENNSPTKQVEDKQKITSLKDVKTEESEPVD